MKNKFYLPMISLLATVTFMFSSCDNDVRGEKRNVSICGRLEND